MVGANRGCRLTIEPGGIKACHLRLPAVMDTLETLRFARRLQDAASQSRHVVADASAVEEIGFAGLQLLALVAAGLTQMGGTLMVEHPSTAAAARIADAGLQAILLGAAADAFAHDRLALHSLRFTDAALDYGREPADALRRLREMGLDLAPVLPVPLPPIGAIEADRILIRFDIALPSEDLVALKDALAEFGGDASIDALPPPASAAATIAAMPAGEANPLIDTQRLKVERLMGEVEELLTRHAALTARAGSLDRDLAAEIKAMGNLLRSLQDHAMAAGLMPVAVLLQQGIASAATAIPAFRGQDIEIEPAVIEPILPLLASRLGRAEAAGLSVSEAEGAVLIEIPWRTAEEMPEGLEAAAASVRGRAEILPGDDGPLLRLELPRSRSTMEALIVRAGDQLAALPVDRTIEILRPDPVDLVSIGGDAQLMRFRGSYLPVIGLCAALGEAAPEAADDTIVVVMQSASGDFGIRVREVTDHRQIMVKPVGNGLSTAVGVIGFSFSAGGIALVLDIDALRSAAIGGG
jgi:chemotaxis protein histidine kinase CheA